MSDLSKFGERLSQERRHKGVREKRDVLPSEIAEELGVSLSTYLRWEAGESWPRDFDALAGYFNVRPAWLRYGAEPREVKPVRDPVELASRAVPEPPAPKKPKSSKGAGGE